VGEGGGAQPLISVFFNGRVIWEDYIRMEEGVGQEANAVLSLPVKSKVGENNFVVIPVNNSVELHRISYRRVNS
jgi:hypothetical protein